eukprot:18900-Heterococcus_DN1.PRE.1
MNAALASILPENNRCRTASSPVPPAASSNGAAAVEAQKEKKEGGGGLLGWALQPVWMGLDALKWAGQTVNDKAVAPVVRYASPMGWASYLFDAVKNLTPQRARDLARIFGNATFNAVGLTQTPAGGKLRSAALRSVDTFASMISAPTGRQLVIDGAAGFVKLAAVVHEQHRSQYRHSRSSSGETETTGTGALPLIAEALDTPETKDALQQMAVLAARFFDLLASHESKAFLQTAADAACRCVELANSPEATIMAAEFTANVVHALEAEHAQHHHHSCDDMTAAAAAAAS